VRAVTEYLRTLRPQLPRPVWLLEAGGVANAVGNGIAVPFLIIYLHEVRDFGLGTAGLVIATLFGVGLIAGPVCGRLVDRIGARTTLMASLALMAAGYGGFPFVHHPWQAFGLALIAGIGNAAFAPSHSSLLAALTSREQRNVAYALHRASDNLGFGVGALAGGLIATTQVPSSFNVLFALDAATFVVFLVLVAFVPSPKLLPEAARAGGRYADVLRDRTFVWLLVVIAVLVTAAYAPIQTVLPPYAKEHASVSEAGIGVIFFVNTLVIVAAQLPVAKALEGRRRMRALALSGLLFVVTCLTVVATGLWLDNSAAVVAFCGAIVVFSVAECIHGAMQNPLIADLAPEHLLGRYMALRTTSWQVGFVAGPTLGSFLLDRAPTALWLGAAAACAGAAGASLLLERRIPVEADITPRSGQVEDEAFRVEWRTQTMRIDDPLSTSAKPAPHQATEASHTGEGGHTAA
jgi:MFS family permease